MQVGVPRKDAAKRTGRIFRCLHSRVAYWREQLSKREPSSDLDVWDRAPSVGFARRSCRTGSLPGLGAARMTSTSSLSG